MHARLSVTIWLSSPLVGQTTDEGGGACGASQLQPTGQKEPKRDWKNPDPRKEWTGWDNEWLPTALTDLLGSRSPGLTAVLFFSAGCSAAGRWLAPSFPLRCQQTLLSAPGASSRCGSLRQHHRALYSDQHCPATDLPSGRNWPAVHLSSSPHSPSTIHLSGAADLCLAPWRRLVLANLHPLPLFCIHLVTTIFFPHC